MTGNFFAAKEWVPLMSSGHMKSIYDPVHHFIELSEAEARLLDSPVMQRLRRLRQLGLA